MLVKTARYYSIGRFVAIHNIADRQTTKTDDLQ